MNVERIRQNLDMTLSRIAAAANRSGRPADAVRLVAVTKRSSVESIRALVGFGVRELGENYPQELWSKVEALSDLETAIRWHLIGHLQTNKVKKTLPKVRMVHSVDSLHLLRSSMSCACHHGPAFRLFAGEYLWRSQQAWVDRGTGSE